VITAGIDAGAATTKVVILNGRTIAGYRIAATAFDFLTAAETIFSDLLAEIHIKRKDVERVYATGYGRTTIAFADKAISEISAHAKGVYFLYPEVQGIIDVGGQDSKIIVVEEGKVIDFLMNDKCSAGTGKFLEYTAKALEVPIGELGRLALDSTHPAEITSMCTVFAESEVISLRARGIAKKDIAAGLIAGIATRVASMAKRKDLTANIAFVGGVAKNVGMKAALEKELRTELFVPFEPQITGALGAALAARGLVVDNQRPQGKTRG
jgi:predicted CoA-substrate-specific enzyme activase